MKMCILGVFLTVFHCLTLTSQNTTSSLPLKILETEQDRINMVLLLGKIHSDDQNIRHKTSDIKANKGKNSEDYRKAIQEWRLIDSINLTKLIYLIDTFSFDTIIKYGEDAVFFVIQHADLAVQKKYLTDMKNAAKNGYLEYSKLAMLEDRLLLGLGMKQIYGTQIIQDTKTGKYFVRPIEEPELLIVRRASVGLLPMSQYLKYYNIKWNVEEYKKMLPDIEKLEQDLKSNQ